MPTYAGWMLAVQWRSGSGVFASLTGIQSISYRLMNNVEVKEECGTRYPFLTEGTYGTSGTIERFYTGSGMWPIFGQNKGEAALDYVDIRICPNGSTNGQPYIIVGGCKFNSDANSHRPSANLMIESWDFLGTGSISTGSIS